MKKQWVNKICAAGEITQSVRPILAIIVLQTPKQIGFKLKTIQSLHSNIVKYLETSFQQTPVKRSNTVKCEENTLWNKSADPLVTFDRAIGEVIGRYVSTTVLRSRSGYKQWFDASSQIAYDAKQTAYRAGCRTIKQCWTLGLICGCSCWGLESLWCCKGVA